jgi:VWFA-related protein
MRIALPLVVGALLVAPDASRQQTFRGAVDLVQLEVSVTDNRDRPVTNLTIEDFEVTDNGARQTILNLTWETVPIDVTLVLDVSASVQGRLLNAIVNAASQIRGRLRDDDRLAIVQFSERVRERVALAGADRVGEVALGPAAGWTSLNDAIATAVSMPPLNDRRQMVLVFTDGHDTVSFLDQDTVLDVARRSRAAVFVVAAGSYLVPTARTLDGVRISTAAYENDLFGQLATATGGVVQRVPTMTMTQPRSGSIRFTRNTYATFLDEAFIKAFDDFRNSYILHYAAEGVPKTGWHDVEVRVTRRGRHQVRSRSGYFGG